MNLLYNKTAKDIRNYLTSRHGVYADEYVVQANIICELCGTFKIIPKLSDDDDEEEEEEEEPKKKQIPSMDLCQMVSLLVIPYLRQEDINEAKKPVNSIDRGMAEQVMNLLLEELENQEGVSLDDFKAVDENFETGTKLTPKLLQHMFDAYGEYSIPEEILDEMVQHTIQATKIMGKNTQGQGGGSDDDNSNSGSGGGSSQNSGSRSGKGSDASGGGGDEEEGSAMEDSMPMINLRTKKKKDEAPKIFFNKHTFHRALTADIQIYDPKVHFRNTTHYEDALNSKIPKGTLAELASKRDIDYEQDFYTAPSIDQAADQYRSYTWMVLLWISFLLYYGLYMWDYYGTVDFNSCDIQFGCDAGTSIVNWLVVFAELSISGTLYIYLGSLGNWATGQPMEGSNQMKTIGGVFVAMGAVACATIVPNFVQGKVFVWNSVKLDEWVPLYWFCFALGIILICLQFIRLISCCASLGPVGDGGKIRSEQCLKQSATRKVNVMVDNAMLMHCAPIVPWRKPRIGQGIRFPSKYASPIVVKMADELHEEHDDPTKEDKYRDGNIETLTGGEGSVRALVNYKWMYGVTETVGGVVWAYQRMADGRIFDEEGIWLSARMVTSNVIQVFMVGMQVVLYFYFLWLFDEQKTGTVAVGRQQRRLLDESVLHAPPKYSIPLHHEVVMRHEPSRERHHLRHGHRERVSRARRLQIVSKVK